MLDWLKRTKQHIPDTYRQAINVAAAPVMRKRVRAALSSLDIPLEWDGDNTNYCGEASAIIVMSIEMDAGIDAEDRSEIEKINSVFFMLIVASHLSELLGVEFKDASIIASVEFVDHEDEIVDVFSKATAAFDTFTHEHEIVNSIRTAVSCWIANPTQDGYAMLVDMYQTTARLVKS